MKPGFQPQAVADPHDAAEAAGLIYAYPDDPGLSRRRTGRGFVYRWPDGQRIDDPATLERIHALAIPPAWSQVWICRDPNGHVQAVGRDEKDRRQYRYHSRFRDIRDRAKYDHLVGFGEALSPLRGLLASDMAQRGLGRRKVLATVVHLLDTTMIRVGNQTYARQNGSYGLTTLRSRHVHVDGDELRFHFKGKSGKLWNLNIHDRRVARIVKSCQELPGQHLFQYADNDGHGQAVTSTDVNDYLRESTGADITAKDFRTWTGTVLAAATLATIGRAESPAAAKRNVARAIAEVAAHLGNTSTICRKCYVHPQIVQSYLNDRLVLDSARPADLATDALDAREAAVLAFLRAATQRAEPISSSSAPSRPSY